MKGKEREKKRGKGRKRERGLTKVLYISASEGDEGENIEGERKRKESTTVI